MSEKAFPLRGRWLAIGETDEVLRIVRADNIRPKNTDNAVTLSKAWPLSFKIGAICY